MAYSQNHKGITIVFKYLRKDNPMVNGIILFKGGLKETDFYQNNEIRKRYDVFYEKQKNEK